MARQPGSFIKGKAGNITPNTDCPAMAGREDRKKEQAMGAKKAPTKSAAIGADKSEGGSE